MVDISVKGEPDPHANTAAQIFDKKPEDVTPQERAVGKQVNFTAALGVGISRERMTQYLRENGIDPEVFDEKAAEVIREVVGKWATKTSAGLTPVPIWKKVEAVSRLLSLSNYIRHPDEGDDEAGFTAELRVEFNEKVAMLRDAGWTHAADELAATIFTQVAAVHDEITLVVDPDQPAKSAEAMKAVMGSYGETPHRDRCSDADLTDDEKALDALYSAVDTLLSAGRFSTVNALLKGWDCDVEGVELTLGLLTMVADKRGHTFTKDELPFRESFHVIASRYIHGELYSEAPEALQNLVSKEHQYLNDKPLPCKTCGATTVHRFRPSPEAGPFWRCGACGNKTCVTPTGRTDGHGTCCAPGEGGMTCAFCEEPI